VPAHPSPVYQLYKKYLNATDRTKRYAKVRTIHNTLTNRVVIWKKDCYDDDTPPKERFFIRESSHNDCMKLIVPKRIWTTYTPDEYKRLRDALIQE
jgi:hypothetical protein